MRKIILLAVFAFIISEINAQISLIKDIRTGNTGSSISNLTKLNNKVFFVADNGTSGEEPFISDLTANGTMLLSNINPNGNGNVNFVTNAVNGKIYFSARSPQTFGTEPFVTDGTIPGTIILKDINNGISSSNPIGFATFNNHVFFAANDGTNGVELWRTDGTSQNTTLFANLNPTGSSYPNSMYEFNGKLYFAADAGNGLEEELYVTDGITNNITSIKDIDPNGSGSPTGFMVLNNKLFFIAKDAAHGYELWVTDGTAAGTYLFKDIRIGSVGSFPVLQIVHNGLLYFTADDGMHGNEIWVTDGTQSGTKLLKDFNVGPASSDAGSFVKFNGKLYYSAISAGKGRELSVSDATADGTKQIMDIYPGAGSTLENSTIIEHKNNLYFVAQISSGDFRLYRMDANEQFSEVLHPSGNVFNPCLKTKRFIEFPDGLVFVGNYDNLGDELYKLGTNPQSIENTNPIFTEIQTYPNPCYGNLTVQFYYSGIQDIKFTLLDLTGKVIYSEDWNSLNEGMIQKNITLPSNIPSGIYSMQLTSNNGQRYLAKVRIEK